MSDLDLTEQLASIDAGLRLASEAVAAEERSRKDDLERIEKAQERRDRNRTLVLLAAAFIAGAGFAFGLIGTIAGLTAGDAADKAQTAIEEIEVSRAEARVGTCEQQRTEEQGDRDAIAGSVAFVLHRVFTDLTPEEEAAVAQLLADHRAEVERLQPLRDCTPEGIKAYLSGDGGYDTTTTTGPP